MKKKTVRWLYDELPDLVAEGVLTPEAEARLRAHYGPVETQRPARIAVIILGIFGALLIGSGIILNLPPGGIYIGLGTLMLAALICVPAIAASLIYLARKRGVYVQTAQGDALRRGMRWVSLAVYLASAAAICIPASTAIAAGMRMQNTPDGNRVSSVEEWEKRTRRPAFTLLDQADLPGYYVCVYDTGSGEIAFCYNQKKPEAANKHSFAVYDTNGQNLQDPARWNKSSNLNNPGDKFIISGMVVPISPDHRGAIQIEFKADSGSGLQLVYQKRLHYERKSAGGVGEPVGRPRSDSKGGDQPQPDAAGRALQRVPDLDVHNMKKE